MTIELQKKGKFEVFKTTKDNKILVLDGKEYYAWIDTSQGHLLVMSDSDHQKKDIINKGNYVLFIPHNEPDMKDDMGHLELREDGKYRTYILPNGLPDNTDEQKKIIETDEVISAQKMEKIIQ